MKNKFLLIVLAFFLIAISACYAESKDAEYRLAAVETTFPIVPIECSIDEPVEPIKLYIPTDAYYECEEYEEYEEYKEPEKKEEYKEECSYPPPRRPMVALTFDDGPSIYTEYILDILEEHSARATFCVLGNRIENWADTIRRAHLLGNEVIGHSWNHVSFTRLDEYNIQRQIVDTSAAIEEVLGVPTTPMFRAPYGALNSTVRKVARELEYSILNWSLDTLDWRYRDPNHIYNFIMANAMEGSIILLHDIRRPTAEAMRYVIPGLIEQGFDLVTASELIIYFEDELKPGFEFRGIRSKEELYARNNR